MKSVASRAAEQDSRVSLADAGFLVVVFLLVCATFAIEDGLALRLATAAGSPIRSSADMLRLVGRADGGVEIDGRLYPLDEVRSAVSTALARNTRLVVVVDPAPGAGSALVAGILGEVRLAGAARVSVKGRGR